MIISPYSLQIVRAKSKEYTNYSNFMRNKLVLIYLYSNEKYTSESLYADFMILS